MNGTVARLLALRLTDRERNNFALVCTTCFAAVRHVRASVPRYQPHRILLTGGAGFIASHVLLLLVNKYPSIYVVNLDKLDVCSSLKNIESIDGRPNYQFIRGSINSADFVLHILRSERIDTVLHFAAQTHVDNSFGRSITFTHNNVMGTHVLLEACKVYGGVKRFIHVSTDEVYGEVEGPAQESSTLLEPTNPYAATKAAAEFLVKAYHRSFALPTIITRGNNVYGPHQYPEKVIPKFICRMLKGQPCCVHGAGLSRRMFLYVEDVALAFEKLLFHGFTGQIYNIGCNTEYNVLEVARDLQKLMQWPATEQHRAQFVEDRKYNDCCYRIDSTKLNALGWQPRVAWIEGLTRTIEWYRAHGSDAWEESAMLEALHPHPQFPVEFMK